MNNKTTAIVSYITIIGWLIAYFSKNDKGPRDPLVSYHLEQSLGLFIVFFIVSIAATVVVSVVPQIGMLVSVIGALGLILTVLGILNAANEALKPVPVVGKFFEKKFAFLS